ncbi:hypothetical protein lerEdw1_001999 [Lerista edwardsae]|nr:hypothetical protein lerEdw1_001999 [Lerista edwardsae]
MRSRTANRILNYCGRAAESMDRFKESRCSLMHLKCRPEA